MRCSMCGFIFGTRLIAINTKKVVKRIGIIVSILLIASVVLLGYAFPTNAASYVNVSVVDFGANGKDKRDDSAAFKSAMLKALDLSSGQTLKVTIPVGTYYLAEDIPVFSNTTIIATGATIISTYNETGPMIHGAHTTSSNATSSSYTLCSTETVECKTHGGYSQTQNVTIDGGVWDRGSSITSVSTTVMSFRHAKNITIKNCTIQNSTDHMINISGVDTANISNITFKNQLEHDNVADETFWGNYTQGDPTRFNSLEAVHTDYTNSEGEKSPRAKPWDNTPCKNITVENCTFQDVYSCIGTHHKANGKRGDGFIIRNNKFIRVKFTSIFLCSFDNAVISNNQSNSNSFARIDDSRVIMTNNSLTNYRWSRIKNDDQCYEGLYIIGGSTVTITGFSISGCDRSGILGTSSKITLKGVSGYDTISGCSIHGICLKNCNATISDYHISNTGATAVKCDGGSVVTLSNCAIAGVADGASGIHADGDNTKLTVTNNTIGGSNSADRIGASGIRGSGGATLIAKNNTIRNAIEYGINCINSKVTATDNTISDTGKAGISVNYTSSAISIVGNNITNTGTNGMYLFHLDNVSVQQNSVDKCGQQGMLIEQCNAEISGNTIGVSNSSTSNSTANSGIRVISSSASIADNTIRNVGENAILSTDSPTLRITNNTLNRAGRSGISIKNSSDSIISNNTISGIQMHGIAVENSNNTSLLSNQLRSIERNGTSIYGSNNCVVTDNDVESNGHALLVNGGSQNAVLNDNTLATTNPSSGRDLRVADTSTATTTNGNRLGNNLLSIDKTTGASYNETVATPTPTPFPVVSSDESGIEGFVERLYTVALGRASDPYGKADWINRVRVGGNTGADLARGFLFSDEFLSKNMSNSDFVDVLYATFFNRPADEHKSDWLGLMDSGWTKTQVIDGFINSTEWANLCLTFGIASGSTFKPNITVEPSQGVIDFATRLYTTCLGRDADQGGLNDWSNQLANMQISGSEAAHGFFFSEEFNNAGISDSEYVMRLYRTFMGREYDQGGYDNWMAALASGRSREFVFQGFAGSAEWAGICADYGILK